MSKADEMFEKLGYEFNKNIINGQYCSYTNHEFYKSKIDKKNEHIIFDTYTNSICFIGKNNGKNLGSRYENNIPLYKDMFVPSCSVNILQAINEKVKELGWNKE